MKLIFESNCSVPAKGEVEGVTPVLQKFIENIVERYHLDALEYFVIADSDPQNFGETVKKYADIVGMDTHILNHASYQAAAKFLDGVDDQGVYRQAIVIKGMFWTQGFCDLLRLTGELSQQLMEKTEDVKYRSLKTIVHEIGYAVERMYQFQREGYCDTQSAFDLSISEEYTNYLERSGLSAWGEYFAERFCYAILGENARVDSKDTSVLDCIKTYCKGDMRNQITERVYRILYFFVQQLAYLHQIGEGYDYSALEEDEEAREYLPFLKPIEESVQKIYAELPEWDESAMASFVDVYHKLLSFEKEKL